MLISNSTGLSIWEIIVAFKNAACNLNFFLCISGSIFNTSVCFIFVIGSMGSSPINACNSKRTLPL